MSEFDNPEIFRSVLETLPTGVYLVDRNRRILFWNAGAENISGYLRQDVVGRFLREHLLATNDGPEASQSDDYDPLNLALRDGKSSTADVSILHKHGYRVPIVLRTVPIRNGHGGIIGVAECFDKNVAASERSRRQGARGDLACLDAVTGVPTRTYMENQIHERLTLFAERHAEFSVVLIEVDHLDRLCSTCGPGVIPTVLRVVAQTVENSLRPTDLVGSWSENRFLALLADCSERELATVANRIRRMVCQSEIEWWGDRLSVTAALGGAGCRMEDSLEMLVERADRSLAESIAAGGNCVIVAA